MYGNHFIVERNWFFFFAKILRHFLKCKTFLNVFVQCPIDSIDVNFMEKYSTILWHDKHSQRMFTFMNECRSELIIDSKLFSLLLFYGKLNARRKKSTTATWSAFFSVSNISLLNVWQSVTPRKREFTFCSYWIRMLSNRQRIAHFNISKN